MAQIAYLKLADLHLWTDNPRIGAVEDELLELESLVKKQSFIKNKKPYNKLITLAESIVENNGIIEPIGVLKFEDGFMVVKEGNRRLACLKMLRTPDIIPREFPELVETFTDLSRKARGSIYDSIPARVYVESENEDLEQWIELRHNGEQEGKGLDPWGAPEKQNWNKYRGKKTPLLDFQTHLIEEGILDKDQVFSISKTNWDRILGTVGRSYLGLDFIESKYCIIIGIQDFITRINKTIEALKGKSVGTVYDNEAIDTFFKSLGLNNGYTNQCIVTTDINLDNVIVNGSSTPEVIDKPQGNKDVDGEAKDFTAITLKEIAEPEPKRRVSTRPAPLLSNLICDLKSSNDSDGIIRLVTELKKISKNKHYVDYPIATAMLMRNLLEQSLICYLKKRNKWSKFYSSKKNEPTLTEILDKFEKDTDIFAQDRTLERYYSIIFQTKGIKEYFNMIVHHPHEIAATPEVLDAIVTGSGYSALIQHIIDFCSEKCGQE
ncbi:MAG TPA: ParB/Srx family N-terminal domain-containing protein [Clostridia bacterium]|nr:ParB/Srx family N-terminal domain-containing protein [Clostridia bacterium]